MSDREDMECSNKSVGLLLPDYVTGQLAEQDRRQVDIHLSDCASCRRMLSVIKILTTSQGVVSDSLESDDSRIGHLSALRIATIYSAPDSLTEQEQNQIREHLTSCSDCASELDFLTSLEQELHQAAGSERRSSPVGTDLSDRWNWRRGPARIFAVAAVLLLTAVTVGFWQLKKPDQMSSGITLLQELNRGETDIPSVIRQSGRPLVRIDAPVPHDRKLFSYQISIRPVADSTVEVPVSTDFSTALVIHMVVDTRNLANGEYDLSVDEIAAGQISKETYHFPFVLRSVE